ncbi:MAG: hypothetical protein M1491_03360 [Deltaproteobacteria bacterium]|nr:hypothetical protein [Deltaproteobacteria bacterium]MCL5278028.1 hypothetical protein [Deltaproteobacteria bacterium]
MTLKILKIVLIVGAVSLSTSSYAVNITPDQWATLKDGGVVKWLQNIKGTEVKKGVAIGIVNAPPDRVWKVIHENNDFIHFMPRMLESILISPSVLPEAESLKFDRATGDPKELISLLKKHRVRGFTGTTGYFFAVLSVPWPATNRWYIIKLEDVVTPDRWFQHWGMVMGNLKTNNGSWELTPLDNNRTLATYTVFADPGGLIPDWIINLGTTQTLPDVIKSLRKRVKEELRGKK